MPAAFSENGSTGTQRVTQRNIGMFTSFSANNNIENRVHVSCSGYYGCQPHLQPTVSKSFHEEAMETELENSLDTTNRKRTASKHEMIDNKRCRLTENTNDHTMPQSGYILKPGPEQNGVLSNEYEL